MIVEIITTGTELLLGEITNTNVKYLAERLNANGFNVFYQTTVGDNKKRLAAVLQQALSRADLIITTGGLGPTQGDITKEVTAEVLGRPMHFNQEVMAGIEQRFAFRGLCMTANNERQAMIPDGALILENDNGTAPGIWLEHDHKVIVNLPGPPREMKLMFEAKLMPQLIGHYGVQGIIHSRILRTVGIGESALEDKISDLIAKQSNPTIALYARQGEIIIRLTAKADNIESADRLIDTLEEVIYQRIGYYIYAKDGDTLPSALGKLLAAQAQTISCAESCTGGLVTSMLTDIPGSSDYVLGSAVTYSNEAKQRLIGVQESSLAKYGAVSEIVAKEMAQGVQKLFQTTFGLGITGIAGPGGATDEKPVGLVYLAVAGPNDEVTVYRHQFTGNRLDIKNRSAMMVLAHAFQIVRRNEK